MTCNQYVPPPTFLEGVATDGLMALSNTRGEKKCLKDMESQMHLHVEAFKKYADCFLVPMTIADLQSVQMSKEVKLQLDRQYKDQTLTDLEKGIGEGKKVVHDGLHGDTLKLYHEATQMLCSCVHPKFEKDQRYNTKPKELLDPCLMHYQIQSNQAAGTSEAEERKGVLHLVQGWIQQKQPEKGLFLSSEFTHSGIGLGGIWCWYHATRPITLVLATIFKELFPKEYEEFKAAFEAGVWLEDDPGPWLGRAIIYKVFSVICMKC
ncbi:hypothetical protein L208DRAFT_1376516 [Tricholoma matsutake]|nr:hypothetical protein L208DRAFT_1376516 [Tricholoma matsutake 945]